MRPFLDRAIYRAIFADSQRRYPQESCGAILADRADHRSRRRAVALGNIQNEMKKIDPENFKRSADTGYYIDPDELIKLFESARAQNLELIAFYHSHPDHGAYWSEEDNRSALWPGTNTASYPDARQIVVSVIDGRAREAAAFGWNSQRGRFELEFKVDEEGRERAVDEPI